MRKGRFAAIVLAAGTGSRMNSDIPKQYMQLCGFPLIYYSLRAFEESEVDEIVLVAGEEDISYCKKEIIERFGLHKVRAVVAGGPERYLSVFEGLRAVKNVDYVLIHDGARPLLDADLIRISMDEVVEKKACVLATKVKDTIKIADENEYVLESLDRNRLWAIQTPQSFSYELIMKAYEHFFAAGRKADELPCVTDDAMLVELMTGNKVKIVQGKYENIKVTTPEDLLTAKIFLQNKI